jgi:formylmethanofuran dehydrogenase subunit E
LVFFVLVIVLGSFKKSQGQAPTHTHTHPAAPTGSAPAAPAAPAAPSTAAGKSASASGDGANDWVALATRLHGGLGSYVALGIRIGLDALADLNVARGEIDVTLTDGPETRCPCIADGLLMSTGATPGRATLHVDIGKAPPGVVGIVTVRHVKTNRTIRYTVLPSTRTQLDEWNQLEPAAKLDVILRAPAAELYQKQIIP